MGEGGGAVSTGPEGLFYNPASALGSEAWQLLFGESNWAQGLAQGDAALLAPPQGPWSLGLGAAWERWAGVESRDSAGNLNGFEEAGGIQLGLNAAFATGPNFSWGLRGGLDSEPFASSTDFNADLGLKGSWLGLNLGGHLQDSLQSASRAQLSLAKVLQKYDWSLELSAGAIFESVDSRASAGLELGLPQGIFLRGGWSEFLLSPGPQPGQYSLGLGFHSQGWSLDYALLSLGELGTTHRFQLSASVSQAKPTAQATPIPSPTASPSPNPTATPIPQEKGQKNEIKLKFLIPSK